MSEFKTWLVDFGDEITIGLNKYIFFQLGSFSGYSRILKNPDTVEEMGRYLIQLAAKMRGKPIVSQLEPPEKVQGGGE